MKKLDFDLIILFTLCRHVNLPIFKAHKVVFNWYAVRQIGNDCVAVDDACTFEPSKGYGEGHGGYRGLHIT